MTKAAAANRHEALSADTRDKILDAAEVLFAERGYSAVSTRNITDKAGVNVAAIFYHFGSKQAVLDEIFKRRLEPINRRREAMLAECIGPDVENYSVADILTAFIAPTLDLGTSSFKLLAGRTSTDPNPEVREVMFSVYDSVARSFFAALDKACPHLSKKEMFWRAACVYGAMMYIRADNSRLQYIFGDDFSLSNAEEAVRYAIPFLTAGMTSPPVDEPAGRLRKMPTKTAPSSNTKKRKGS
ncbi:TetR/AcrR family transcriptional regulator [Roseiarcaceae bacterium H3SJ34-1]|uniref:TetR/AcrR family transcriptional regulator n=1 Tax=Terripilifer ovatus TaxID=3032367 RepID=UPI003AB94342|nr:TetR/AcrR family transcriptional regulator [Roseiarcaceae bacterium H3SJ34-1]